MHLLRQGDPSSHLLGLLKDGQDEANSQCEYSCLGSFPVFVSFKAVGCSFHFTIIAENNFDAESRDLFNSCLLSVLDHPDTPPLKGRNVSLGTLCLSLIVLVSPPPHHLGLLLHSTSSDRKMSPETCRKESLIIFTVLAFSCCQRGLQYSCH